MCAIVQYIELPIGPTFANMFESDGCKVAACDTTVQCSRCPWQVIAEMFLCAVLGVQ